MAFHGIDLGATWGYESEGDCFVPGCNVRFCPELVSLECNQLLKSARAAALQCAMVGATAVGAAGEGVAMGVANPGRAVM